MVVTGDGSIPDDVEGYDVVAFVHTSGNVLAERSQRAALERYMANGGGFLVVHAASSMAPDVATDWPWCRDLVGASFRGHTVTRVHSDCPAIAGIGDGEVLSDESIYEPYLGDMGDDHPIVWWRGVAGRGSP